MEKSDIPDAVKHLSETDTAKKKKTVLYSILISVVATLVVGLSIGLTVGRAKEATASHATTWRPDLKPVPHPAPGGSLAEVLEAIGTKTSLQTLQAARDAQLLSSDLVEAFVGLYLNVSQAAGADPGALQVLQGTQWLLVRYLHARQLNDVLDAMRWLASVPDPSRPSAELLERIQVVMDKAFNLQDFRAWIRTVGRGLREKRLVSQQQLDSLSNLTLEAEGAGGVPLLSSDPLQQLELYEQRYAVLARGSSSSSSGGVGAASAGGSARETSISAEGGSSGSQERATVSPADTRQLGRKLAAGTKSKPKPRPKPKKPAPKPKSPPKGKPKQGGSAKRTPPRSPSPTDFWRAVSQNVGLREFKAAKIGVVFHMFQFADSKRYLYPVGTYRSGDAPARHILSEINRLYAASGMNLQFYLKEYRSNTRQYPYLFLGTVKDYQQAALKQEDFSCSTARARNYQSDKYINVYVVGTDTFPGFGSGIEGYTSSITPKDDTCDARFRYNSGTPRSRHVTVTWDVMDRSSPVLQTQWQEGASILGHELGHMLGLLHTHQGGCRDRDLVADTPPNKSVEDQPYAGDLNRWCIAYRMGRQPNRAALKAFDSCKSDKLMDNVFNIMSYTPPACNLMFTPGQVRRVQSLLLQYNKAMLKVASGSSGQHTG